MWLPTDGSTVVFIFESFEDDHKSPLKWTGLLSIVTPHKNCYSHHNESIRIHSVLPHRVLSDVRPCLWCLRSVLLISPRARVFFLLSCWEEERWVSTSCEGVCSIRLALWLLLYLYHCRFSPSSSPQRLSGLFSLSPLAPSPNPSSPLWSDAGWTQDDVAERKDKRAALYIFIFNTA